jgi:hypothetical protein
MEHALNHSAKMVTAVEYDQGEHGSRLFCIDPDCKAPVIHVGKSEHAAAHFKTTGRGESRHHAKCGFFAPMDMVNSIEKVKFYQNEYAEKGLSEIIIKLNMRKIDPDYSPKVIERDLSEKKKTDLQVKIKNDDPAPQSIQSVKSIVKLLTDYEPDVLASILISVGGGVKIPLPDIILDQQVAHNLIWEDDQIPSKIGYFVYGKVENVIRRKKVLYINFERLNDVPFTLVLFESNWRHFTHTEEDLKGKTLLSFGHLQKNTFKQEEKLTQMIIKGDRYIEFFGKRKRGSNEEDTN